MKKYTLGIVGIIIQLLAIGFMFYGMMHNTTILWIAFPFIFIGMAMAIFNALKNAKSKQ